MPALVRRNPRHGDPRVPRARWDRGARPVTVDRRHPSLGRIHRLRRVRFTFDGAPYEGFPGDTLASALIANGVDVVGRGIYSGRPRGVFSAGLEEPNALVQLDRADGTSEPMVRATTVDLEDGLAARSLTGRGRLAGHERQAGHERLAGATHTPNRDDHDHDPARFDRRFAHCDVLVIGGG
ncbi:MAG: (2Fe-2S)-binding protein, partial [Chloroflexi bacterium]|nr:(2Fe-2S)-binding protein [Chloroflexota bacterium]